MRAQEVYRNSQQITAPKPNAYTSSSPQRRPPKHRDPTRECRGPPRHKTHNNSKAPRQTPTPTAPIPTSGDTPHTPKHAIPPTPPQRQGPVMPHRRLILCLDGTWNSNDKSTKV